MHIYEEIRPVFSSTYLEKSLAEHMYMYRIQMK